MTDLSSQAVLTADRQQSRYQAALAASERIARQIEAEIEAWARHAQLSNGFGDAAVEDEGPSLAPRRRRLC